MAKTISTWLLKILGWTITLELKQFPDKYIVAVVPHTSNWDFPIGVMVRSALDINVQFVGKHTLFFPPLGWLLKWMGGIAVNGSKPSNRFDETIRFFKEKKKMAICIAPEGTRKKVDRLKTGFYRIAKGTNSPVVLCKFDWENKTVVFSEPFYPTDDMEADFAYFKQYFKGVKGYRPEYSYLP